MKKIFTLLIGIVFSITILNAQAPPQAFSLKAVIADDRGNPVSNKSIRLRISILQDNANGIAVYAETFSPTTNSAGQVDVVIGHGTVINGDFSAIGWSMDAYFLKMEAQIKPKDGYRLISATQLLSVPYALYAGEAGNGFSGDYDDLTNKPDLAAYATKDMQNQNISNLANPVNNQDAATKAYVDALLQRIDNLEALVLGTKAQDMDGNMYNTVTIGDQVWMKENLKTTRYNDGTAIPLVTDGTTFIHLGSAAYCWYNNDEATYKNDYGALYNQYAVNTGKLCPAGWHVPSWEEFEKLRDYLGGTSVAGGKLKESGTAHWASPNTGATNESGFTALPGGGMYGDPADPSENTPGEFRLIGESGAWWSTTESRWLILSNNSGAWEYGWYIPWFGFSVRCLKD
jgi:uncharacterized protein (TIGR02145 family)